MKHSPFEPSGIHRCTVTFAFAAILSIVAPLQVALCASGPATEPHPLLLLASQLGLLALLHRCRRARRPGLRTPV
jgi:hypothetical protein